MLSKKFTTKTGSTVLVHWNFLMTKASIEVDGKSISENLLGRELRDGKIFSLPDESKLSVRFRQTILGSRLEVEQDGKPVPGSTHDPVWRIKQAEQTLWIVGGRPATP